MGNERFKIDWNLWERQAVKWFYLVWLVVALLLMGASVYYDYLQPEELRKGDFFPDLYRHLLYILYMPIIGLWCMKKGYNIGYICLGILMVYTFVQLKMFIR